MQTEIKSLSHKSFFKSKRAQFDSFYHSKFYFFICLLRALALLPVCHKILHAAHTYPCTVCLQTHCEYWLLCAYRHIVFASCCTFLRLHEHTHTHTEQHTHTYTFWCSCCFCLLRPLKRLKRVWSGAPCHLFYCGWLGIWFATLSLIWKIDKAANAAAWFVWEMSHTAH